MKKSEIIYKHEFRNYAVKIVYMKISHYDIYRNKIKYNINIFKIQIYAVKKLIRKFQK